LTTAFNIAREGYHRHRPDTKPSSATIRVLELKLILSITARSGHKASYRSRIARTQNLTGTALFLHPASRIAVTLN
jgi:hypothetical protein